MCGPNNTDKNEQKVLCTLSKAKEDISRPILCRVITKESVFPGESLFVKPDIGDISEGETVFVEPRIISKTYVNSAWPRPHLTTITDGAVLVLNDTQEVIPIHKNEHLCQIFKTKSIECDNKTVSTPKICA